MMRFLIFGAGAVGTLFGGLLAKAGHQVLFVGRKWNIEAIRSKGIEISGIWGKHSVPPQSAFENVEEIPEKERDFDLILICTKAFTTEEAIKQCLPVVGESTQVLSCQNGYGNCQTIARYIGWEKTLGARVITGVELPTPGVIRVTVHAASVQLGHYINQIPFTQIISIAMTFNEAGIPTEPTKELEQYIWAKILYNAALNPMGALLGVTYGQLAEHTNTHAIIIDVVHEAFQVTRAHRIQQFWETPEEYLEEFYQKMIPPTAAHYPSMLRDLEKQRPTEIDAINGAIAMLGEEKNIPTPVNNTIISLLKFREEQALL